MRIYLHRHKQTKKHAGYTTATFPAQMNGNYETLLKDVSEEEFEKLQNSWEVNWNGDEIKEIIEPQVLKDERAEKEQKKILKQKIDNKTATLSDVLEYLK